MCGVGFRAEETAVLEADKTSSAVPPPLKNFDLGWSKIDISHLEVREK